mmetsp:Transcript_31302/g.58353  ORF Transcript_31302/g.58353 Transcript_31302/m.58353 type:complete len:91 (+) Transcript_31302:889-1161(+)
MTQRTSSCAQDRCILAQVESTTPTSTPAKGLLQAQSKGSSLLSPVVAMPLDNRKCTVSHILSWPVCQAPQGLAFGRGRYHDDEPIKARHE